MRLRSVKAEIRLNTRVETLKRDGPGWTIKTNTGEQFQGGCSLSRCARVHRSIVAVSDERSARDRNSRRSITPRPQPSTSVTGASAIAHPLNGFGFVVPFIEKRSLIACTFSSVKFSGRAPEDHVLLRAFAGGALQPEIFALDEAEMSARVEADLRELLGISEEPLFVEVAKWERSMPQYEVGHLDRVNEIENLVNELPGSHLPATLIAALVFRIAFAAAKLPLSSLKPSTDYADSV